MNIKITYNWLLEYLDTDASPFEIQKYLSLCGPTVDFVKKVGDDYVFNIEVTSNRVDTASVQGIAQESQAILPTFGKRAVLKKRPSVELDKNVKILPLEVKDPKGYCQRIIAIAMNNITVAPSPKFIRDRLTLCDVRALNNLVDISNYVMLETGHPTHVFDYDRVKTGRLVIRHAKLDETITTLDMKKYHLTFDDLVIDDGTGRIIDFPGIMGAANTVVTPQTTKIIFLIESPPPYLIRQTIMRHKIRTLAASYNEKGPSAETSPDALKRGVELYHKYANARVSSRFIDLYPHKIKSKPIIVTSDFIGSRMGVQVLPSKISKILESLSFVVKIDKDKLVVSPPSDRISDITSPEDLVEEVARIWGYHNLSNQLPVLTYVKQPKESQVFYRLQLKIKNYLKHKNLHEVMNYSMISKSLIIKAGLNVTDHLKIRNALSEEITYMRTHLLPSLIQNIYDNQGKDEKLRLFEISKTYKKIDRGLPDEKYKLGIALNTSLEELKKIVFGIFFELNIIDCNIANTKYPYLAIEAQAEAKIGNQYIARYGKLANLHKERYGLKSDVFVAVFDLETLFANSRFMPSYKTINPFAHIKLDWTVKTSRYTTYSRIEELVFQVSNLVEKIEVADIFKNKLTLRFYFSAKDRNLNEQEAIRELGKIKKAVNKN